MNELTISGEEIIFDGSQVMQAYYSIDVSNGLELSNNIISIKDEILNSNSSLNIDGVLFTNTIYDQETNKSNLNFSELFDISGHVFHTAENIYISKDNSYNVYISGSKTMEILGNSISIDNEFVIIGRKDTDGAINDVGRPYKKNGEVIVYYNNFDNSFTILPEDLTIENLEFGQQVSISNQKLCISDSSNIHIYDLNNEFRFRGDNANGLGIIAGNSHNLHSLTDISNIPSPYSFEIHKGDELIIEKFDISSSYILTGMLNTLSIDRDNNVLTFKIKVNSFDYDSSSTYMIFEMGGSSIGSSIYIHEKKLFSCFRNTDNSIDNLANPIELFDSSNNPLYKNDVTILIEVRIINNNLQLFTNIEGTTNGVVVSKNETIDKPMNYTNITFKTYDYINSDNINFQNNILSFTTSESNNHINIINTETDVSTNIVHSNVSQNMQLLVLSKDGSTVAYQDYPNIVVVKDLFDTKSQELFNYEIDFDEVSISLNSDGTLLAFGNSGDLPLQLYQYINNSWIKIVNDLNQSVFHLEFKDNKLYAGYSGKVNESDVEQLGKDLIIDVNDLQKPTIDISNRNTHLLTKIIDLSSSNLYDTNNETSLTNLSTSFRIIQDDKSKYSSGFCVSTVNNKTLNTYYNNTEETIPFTIKDDNHGLIREGNTFFSDPSDNFSITNYKIPYSGRYLIGWNFYINTSSKASYSYNFQSSTWSGNTVEKLKGTYKGGPLDQQNDNNPFYWNESLDHRIGYNIEGLGNRVTLAYNDDKAANNSATCGAGKEGGSCESYKTLYHAYRCHLSKKLPNYKGWVYVRFSGSQDFPNHPNIASGCGYRVSSPYVSEYWGKNNMRLSNVTKQHGPVTKANSANQWGFQPQTTWDVKIGGWQQFDPGAILTFWTHGINLWPSGVSHQNVHSTQHICLFELKIVPADEFGNRVVTGTYNDDFPEIHLEKKLKNESSFNSIAETSFIDGTNESRQIIDNFNKDDEIRLTTKGYFSLENSSFYGTIINPKLKSKLSRKSNLSVQTQLNSSSMNGEYNTKTNELLCKNTLNCNNLLLNNLTVDDTIINPFYGFQSKSTDTSEKTYISSNNNPVIVDFNDISDSSGNYFCLPDAAHYNINNKEYTIQKKGIYEFGTKLWCVETRDDNGYYIEGSGIGIYKNDNLISKNIKYDSILNINCIIECDEGDKINVKVENEIKINVSKSLFYGFLINLL